jgi:hypothetical protein
VYRLSGRFCPRRWNGGYAGVEQLSGEGAGFSYSRCGRQCGKLPGDFFGRIVVAERNNNGISGCIDAEHRCNCVASLVVFADLHSAKYRSRAVHPVRVNVKRRSAR